MSRESDVVAMFTNKEHPLSVAEIASRIGVSRPTVYLILKRRDVALEPRRPRETAAPPRARRPSVPRQLRDKQGVQARFKPYHTEDPEAVRQLAEDHPAILEARSLFPGNRVGTFESPRFLVSGKNNPKTGSMVTKGEWAGFPIYTLTLEERATCPKSCAVYRGCYGNSMQWPRRNDAHDPDFIPALAAEVITKAREHPKGLVVRLHVLGDFFSVPYVHAWGHLMAMLPMLHVYGYTARRTDIDTPDSRQIAAEVEKLNLAHPDRWVIRTSHPEAGPLRSVVVNADPRDPGGLVCPAQTEKTACRASCGLCWAEGFREKTIYFLRHGQTYGAHKKGVDT